MIRSAKETGRPQANPPRAKARVVAARSGSFQTYDRNRHLPALIACWPEEIGDMSIEGATRIVAALRKALRGERRRGKAGHWTYDLNRHMSLTTALKAESARLDSLAHRGRPSPGREPVRMPQEERALKG